MNPEIGFVLSRAADCPRITDLIAADVIPERVTHNDTKLNNVLLDDETMEGVCVIDLDTTMPGSALYDFGDMSAARSFLNAAEVENLAFSGKLLTLECGIRFLTDFLQGDIYFKIKHPAHNLARCRNRFALVTAIEMRLPEMEKVMASHAG